MQYSNNYKRNRRNDKGHFIMDIKGMSVAYRELFCLQISYVHLLKKNVIKFRVTGDQYARTEYVLTQYV